jgi:hypothetical protein
VKKHCFFPSITPLYLGWGNDGNSSINFPSCNCISTATVRLTIVNRRKKIVSKNLINNMD